MLVKKRSGKLAPVNYDEIAKRLRPLASDLELDLDALLLRALPDIADGASTSEIDQLCCDAAASLVSKNPDFATLAKRIAVSNHHKNTKATFSEYVAQVKAEDPSLFASNFYAFVEAHAPQLDAAIHSERDLDICYPGQMMLLHSYLVRLNNRPVERWQYMLMRVSIFLHLDSPTPIEHILETYEHLSAHDFTQASPTLYNAAKTKPQLASCFLVCLKDDSMEMIYETLKECAMIAKNAGGIGVAVSRIRARGSHIAGTNGTASGLVPMLAVFNALVRFVTQGGLRKGNAAIYLEPWHADVLEFIALRKNTGSEENRCRDLFLALYVPDLFMKRVEEDGDWSLFSPDTAPGLEAVYGEEFEALYCKYEEQGLARNVIKARYLMKEIARAQIETGNPYVVYKDAVNRTSNQKNIGIIRSSNLCAEIVEHSSEKETAVCNLASVCLGNYLTEAARKTDFFELARDGLEPASYLQFFDFEKLAKVVKVMVRNLDNCIDKSYYATQTVEGSNVRNRPIAIGMQGLADVFLKMKLPFDSPQARELNLRIAEHMYFAAVEASVALARERSTYQTYPGSPASQGVLHIDHFPKAELTLDLERLRAQVKQYGLRNSLLTALMPTAGTAHLLGNCESFEPVNSNVYMKRLLAGDFVQINHYMVGDLQRLGVWNETLRQAVLENDGSVQSIDTIPEKFKKIYRTVWEVPQKTLLDMAADRQPFVDQAQSLNVYIANASIPKIVSMHHHGWKLGLKTGLYYLRSRAATEAIKVIADNSKKPRVMEEVDDDEGCISCQA